MHVALANGPTTRSSVLVGGNEYTRMHKTMGGVHVLGLGWVVNISACTNHERLAHELCSNRNAYRGLSGRNRVAALISRLSTWLADTMSVIICKVPTSMQDLEQGDVRPESVNLGLGRSMEGYITQGQNDQN